MKNTYVFVGVTAFIALFAFSIVPAGRIGGGYDIAFALTAADCKVCHTGNMTDMHHLAAQAKGYACSYCHKVTYDPVRKVYTYDVITDCTVCHGGATHETAHAKTMVNSSACLQCHVNNAVVEHVTNQALTCDTCNKSTNQAVLN